MSSSTHRTYATGINNFCTYHNIQEPFPLSQPLLCYFIAYLANQGLSTGAIKVYLSALCYRQVALGFPDPNTQSTTPKLKLITNGVTRVRSKQSAMSKGPSRLPITPTILHQIKQVHVWSRDCANSDTIMLWAVWSALRYSLASFVWGELAVSSISAFDPSIHLMLRDIAIDSRDHPSLVQIHLKVSKTDQERKGVAIFICKTGDDIFPVAALTTYSSSQ